MNDLTFGQRLVHFRTRKKLLQKELAEKADITPTALNYYEKDKREPNVLIIKKLASALEITGDELLGFSSSSNQLSSEAKRIAMLYDKANDDDKAVVQLTLKKYDAESNGNDLNIEDSTRTAI